MTLTDAERSTPVGAIWALVAVLCFSTNDVLVKFLSGGYPLYQLIFFRTLFGLAFILAVLVPLTGGALSMLNTSFVLRMSDKFAERLQAEAGGDPGAQAALALQLAFGREAKPEELAIAGPFIAEHGLPAYCRVLFNANEFVYVN